MEEINIWLQMLQNIGLATCGLAIFVGWKVREHLNEFSWSKLFKHNKAYWIWAVIMQTLFAFILAVSPESATAIKTMIGLDVSNEPAAFITLGYGLSMAANTAVKKKLDKKQSN